MIYEFKKVPEEVQRMEETGIFDIAYTHITSHTARKGVEKTKQLMATRIAIDQGIIPFSGEWDLTYRVHDYLVSAYCVSLSSYPQSIDRHNWHRYLQNNVVFWVPEYSQKAVEYLKENKQKFIEEPYGLSDFMNTGRRSKVIMAIDGCIEVEELRQKAYAEMSDEERYEIQNPKPEIYVFGQNLEETLSPGEIFGKRLEQHSHPFALARIKLEQYLKGMFTSLDVKATKDWVFNVAGRDIPVASIDALATWEGLHDIKP